MFLLFTPIVFYSAAKAEKGRKAMFCIGEKVCYPMHGIGEISGIEQRTVLGSTAEYYVLKFASSRVNAMVPISAAQSVGLRRPITREEGEKVLSYIKRGESGAEAAWGSNWNRRYRENCDRLKKGEIYAVADVFLCLNARQNEKGLSAGEIKMLALTRRLIKDELIYAGCDEKEVVSAIG